MATMDNREITGYLVDANTGEMRREVRRGDKFVPMRLYDAPRPEKDYLRLGGDFVKVRHSALAVLREKSLSPTEWRLLWLLCAHMRYNNGKACHKNGRRFTAKSLAGKLRREEKTVRTALHTLQNAGFLLCERGATGFVIRLNPYFVQKGQLVENGLQVMFQDTDFYRSFRDENG